MTDRHAPNEDEGTFTREGLARARRGETSHLAAATAPTSSTTPPPLPGDSVTVLADVLNGRELTVEWWHDGAGVAITTPADRLVLAYVDADRLARALDDCTSRARAAITGRAR